MTAPPIQFSEDQASAYDTVVEMLRSAGIDLDDGLLQPPRGDS